MRIRLEGLFLLLFVLVLQSGFAQDQARINGNLELNANFFLRDTVIGATNTPQYDHQLFGAESWLQLTYNYKGFEVGGRFDFYNNSNLINPQSTFNGQGVGRWYISKDVQNLGITIGFIYDQIGSGIIFRAYEGRYLGIDNAVFGGRLTYNLSENWQVKGFVGKQKNRFDLYESVIKGGGVEGFLSFGDTKKVTLAPGIGIVNRTLDNNSMSLLVSSIRTYDAEDKFVPNYNNYAASFYNTLTAGKFNWYVEAAYKSHDAFRNQNGDQFLEDTGTVIYTSLGYAAKGLGLVLEYKRTENFESRIRPQEQLNRGLVNFLPPLTRVNTYRLLSRYNAATQFIGEQAYQVDLSYKVNKRLGLNGNYSRMENLSGDLLYEEIFTEVTFKKKRAWQLIAGVQLQKYNQEVFEFKVDVPLVETITPYAEFLYKFDRKKALRIEAQYMNMNETESGGKLVKSDFGDWLFGLAEFSIAPKWTFTVSDMFNLNPGKLSPTDADGEELQIHYPRFDIFYTHKSNRFSLSYIKQVEGVVCSGGICRLEPAFSGARFTVNSIF